MEKSFFFLLHKSKGLDLTWIAENVSPLCNAISLYHYVVWRHLYIFHVTVLVSFGDCEASLLVTEYPSQWHLPLRCIRGSKCPWTRNDYWYIAMVTSKLQDLFFSLGFYKLFLWSLYAVGFNLVKVYKVNDNNSNYYFINIIRGFKWKRQIYTWFIVQYKTVQL